MGPTFPFSLVCCLLRLARNILFLSLVLDNALERSSASLWNIYYHFYLDDNDLKILQCQARKLLDVSISAQSWQNGPYGQTLQFFDESTRSSVREIWKTYCSQDVAGPQKADHIFLERLKNAKNLAQKVVGEGSVLSAVRSVAPMAIKALSDVSAIYERYWKHGVLSWNESVLINSCRPNPMIASSLTTTSVLHYGLDPCAGFHLALAYITCDKTPNFENLTSQRSGPERMVQAAHLQLHTWAVAFRDYARHITICILVSDAFVACDTLKSDDRRIKRKPESENTHGMPHTHFNVIDTSNLIDHFGSLNLLPAVSPLLEETPQATIHSDLLIKQEGGLADNIARILHGDFATVALLLGLFPAAYWTNTSTVAPEEEMFSEIFGEASKISKNRDEQIHMRLSWKHSPKAKINTHETPLYVSSGSLSRVLYQIYKDMFGHESLEQTMKFAMKSGSLPKRYSQPVYHRGSFVAFLSYIKTRINCDWPITIAETLNRIENDNCLFLGRMFLQELHTYLHLYGLHSSEFILHPESTCETVPAQKSLGRWSSLPPILCVTLKMSTSQLQPFFDLSAKPTELGTPFVHGVIRSTESYKGNAWENRFAAVQLCFGTLDTTELEDGLNSPPKINVDSQGWKSQSACFISFWAPTWVLLQQPEDAVIAFALQPNVPTIQTFVSLLGPDLIVYRTKQGDKANVFLSKDTPILSSSEPGSVKGVLSIQKQPHRNEDSQASALNVELSSDLRLDSMISRLNVKPGTALEALRNKAHVSVSQLSPFALLVTISGSSDGFDFPVHFPVPILKSTTDLRIARTSAYIELVARVNSKLTSGLQQDELLGLTYPGTLTPWGIPYVTIDLQPVIDLRQHLEWLVTHVSFQMSEEERKLREKYLKRPDPCPSARVNFKDSLFSLFMHFTGLQGGKANIFGLNLPDGGGVHILIFVSELRLDLGSRTAFLDTAVLPLTHERVQNLHGFLSKLPSQKLCQVMVDMDELKLWHRMLPIFVERCRTWKHDDKCRGKYNRPSDTAWKKGKDPLCQCGRGKLPSDFNVDLPQWTVAKKHSVRAAISPLYFVSYVDKYYKPQFGFQGCAACGKNESEDGTKLSACGRCKRPRYCSKSCQTSDWPKHKKFCKA